MKPLASTMSMISRVHAAVDNHAFPYQTEYRCWIQNAVEQNIKRHIHFPFNRLRFLLSKAMQARHLQGKPPSLQTPVSTFIPYFDSIASTNALYILSASPGRRLKSNWAFPFLQSPYRVNWETTRPGLHPAPTGSFYHSHPRISKVYCLISHPHESCSLSSGPPKGPYSLRSFPRSCYQLLLQRGLPFVQQLS